MPIIVASQFSKILEQLTAERGRERLSGADATSQQKWGTGLDSIPAAHGQDVMKGEAEGGESRLEGAVGSSEYSRRLSKVSPGQTTAAVMVAADRGGVAVSGAVAGTGQPINIEKIFTAAGLDVTTAKEIGRVGIESSEEAAELFFQVLQSEPNLRGWGPRLVATRIFYEAAALSRGTSPRMLQKTLRAYASLVTLRPDGYLVQAASGKPIANFGEPQALPAGMVSGNLTVGDLYYNSMGVLFSVDDQLARSSELVSEIGIQSEPITSGLTEGMHAAVVGSVEMVYDLGNFLGAVRERPELLAEALSHLPSWVVDTAKSAPHVLERFVNMTPADQVRTLSSLGGRGLATSAMARGISKLRMSAAGSWGTPSAPALRILDDGTLAFAPVAATAATVDSAVVELAAVLAGLQFMQAQWPNPQDVKGRQKQWGEQYGEHNRKPEKVDKPPIEIQSEALGDLKEMPKNRHTWRDIHDWLTRNGFEHKGQSATHHKYRGPNGKSVMVPEHSNRVIGEALRSAIRRQIRGAQR